MRDIQKVGYPEPIVRRATGDNWPQTIICFVVSSSRDNRDLCRRTPAQERFYSLLHLVPEGE